MKNLIFLIALSLTFHVAAQDAAFVNVTVQNFEEVPIPGAQIHFFDINSEKIISGVSDKNGKFHIDLLAGQYEIQLKSIGQVKDYSAIEIPTLGEGESYGEVEIIIRYEEESTFTLSNLHFETGKSIIKSSSFEELDELVKYLSLKPGLKIEVGGHTDNDGSVNSNLVLSKNRAEAVKKYLISKGINSSRIIAKGYGETSPIAKNDSAKGKALNRRTEIHILN